VHLYLYKNGYKIGHGHKGFEQTQPNERGVLWNIDQQIAESSLSGRLPERQPQD
jgi:hypothetical protein